MYMGHLNIPYLDYKVLKLGNKMLFSFTFPLQRVNAWIMLLTDFSQEQTSSSITLLTHGVPV